MKSPGQKLRIIVGGLVGQYPLGGVAYDYFHYLLGLHELGHDVYYHEDTWVWPLDPALEYPVEEPTHTVNFIRDFFLRHAPELAEKWCYVLLHDKHYGMTKEAFDEVARTADVYLNVSGVCFTPDALAPTCKRVFIDTDPGYNQVVMNTRPWWSDNVDRWVDGIRGHDVHLTYAENVWADDCAVPRMDLDWRPTRCVVTLPDWASIREQPPAAGAPFTTIMTWSYFKGPIIVDGVEYDAKASQYERFRDVARLSGLPMKMAVSGERYDPEAIRKDGWGYVRGKEVSLTPGLYQDFIRDSAGEFSVAKHVYAGLNTGWFSCRTACYLAAGRPAVVQDTRWSRFVPSGEGVIAFDSVEGALDGLRRVTADPARHRAAAYDVAREYLAPDRVLTPMLEAIFATDHRAAPLPHSK